MKKYGYTEKRKTTMDNLIKLCITRKWFTMSTCKEYDAFLSKAVALDNITTDDLVELASDVYEYSDCGDMEIETIMWHIATACYLVFERDE